jgi:hypothetical protein
MSEIALIVLKYSYLVVLWAFVLSAIALIRRDIFLNSKLAGISDRKSNGGDIDSNVAAPVAPIHGGSALAAYATDYNDFDDNNTSSEPSGVLVIGGIAEGDYFNIFDTPNDFELPIGRDISSAIRLDDSFVSSRHARIFKHQNRFFLEDLHSTNGTIINGKKIKGVIPLPKGERISIGKNILEIV